MELKLPAGFKFDHYTKDGGKECHTEIFREGSDFDCTGAGTVLKVTTKKFQHGVSTWARVSHIRPSADNPEIVWEVRNYGDYSHTVRHSDVKRATAGALERRHAAMLADAEFIAAIIAGAFPDAEKP